MQSMSGAIAGAVKSAAKGTAIKVGTVVKQAVVGDEKGSIAPDPPGNGDRREWKVNLCQAFIKYPGFAISACCCFICANTRIDRYRKTGVYEFPGFCSFDFCCNCICSSVCDEALCCISRGLVRERVHMTNDECCEGEGQCVCPKAECWDTLCTMCWCWGCGMAQEREELRLYFEEHPLNGQRMK